MINRIFPKNNWSDIEDWKVVFYILTGRFGIIDELVGLRWAFQCHGVSGVVKEIERYFKDWESRNQITFVGFAPNSIFIDITHTINYPFNTGIQTVVRKIGNSMQYNPKVNWVIWNELSQVWQLVDREIVSNRLPFQKTSSKNSKASRQKSRVFILFAKAFWHGVYSSYRYLISNPTLETKAENIIMSRAKRYIHFLRTRKMRIRSFGKIQSPLLCNQTLLIVEPIQGESVTRRLYQLPKVVKLSVLVYDLIPISHPEFFATNSIQNFPNYLKVLSKASNLIAISEFTSSQIRQYIPHREAKNLSVIPLPVNLDVTVDDTSEDFSVPIFLCVGSLEPRKNHLSILKAAEACWDQGLKFDLTLVGGQGWNNFKIMEYIAMLQNKNYMIKVIKDASNEQILKLYSEAYAFITVPWVEGFGLPLAEAISTGKFVIASKIESHLEFGQVEGVYFIDPDNIDMISTTMKSIVKNRITNTQRINRRETQLSWDDYCAKLLTDATK
jgi:glycosyltransferase involved in cell wall biosynthesis